MAARALTDGDHVADPVVSWRIGWGVRRHVRSWRGSPKEDRDDPRGHAVRDRRLPRPVNALIGPEAFLLIAFTMALAYVGMGLASNLFWIGPTLAAIGSTLATLAWPRVLVSCRIIVEWSVLFVDVLNTAQAASTIAWRPSVFVHGDRRIHADHRRGMLFSRFVPGIFMAARVVLAALVLVSRRP